MIKNTHPSTFDNPVIDNTRVSISFKFTLSLSDLKYLERIQKEMCLSSKQEALRYIIAFFKKRHQ